MNPRLRFKQDDGTDYPDWEEKKFGEVFKFLNNNTFSRDMLIYENAFIKNIHYGDILIKFGDICNIEYDDLPFIKPECEISRYNLLRNGDIIIADTAEDETVGKAIEIYNLNNEKVISGLHTMACRPIIYFSPKYLGYYINSFSFHEQLRPYMQGIKVTSVNRKNIVNTIIKYPLSLEEQQKIGSFLSDIDEVILTTSQEIKKLEELKKGVMQKIFSQEVRFKRKDGTNYPDWEEKKLGDICNSFSGGTPRTGIDEYYNGNINFIRSGEIHNSKTELFISEKGLKNSSAKLVNVGDILLALYGATSGEIDISKMNGAINQAILCIRPKEGFNKKFIVESFRYNKNNILKMYLQGGQGNLSAQNMLQLYFSFPCLEEQEKIADCLFTFDEAISLSKQELEKWKLLKKGFLQQMFV